MEGQSRGTYCQATAILDSNHPMIVAFADGVMATSPSSTRSFLQATHQRLSVRLTPIYSLRERQHASATLARGRGSCSQRMAVLEAVARAKGIDTRSRALWLSGQFWSLRFPWLKRFLPSRVLIAWPEFWIDGQWEGFEMLYGPLPELAERTPHGFTNRAGETLFDAVERTAIDWHGQTRGCGASQCDLSGFVMADEGVFPSRDAVFDRYGVLLHQPRGCVFELLMSGHVAA